MKKIIITLTILSTMMCAEFTRDANGIVTDSSTKLQWQDDYRDNGDSIKYIDWAAAITYCEDSDLGEHEDWRLPNLNELTSLVDDTKGSAPSLNENFNNTASNHYWSSTTYASLSSFAWVVNFYSGLQSIDTKNYGHYVRCVRAGQ